MANRGLMFSVTNRSGEKFVTTPVPGTQCFRIGNYTVGPLHGDATWSVYDWTKDEDVYVGSRLGALRSARGLVERSHKQHPKAIRG